MIAVDPSLTSFSYILLIPTELNPRSHGHACILTLATTLRDAGLSIALLPYKPYPFFRRYFPKLPASVQSMPFIASLQEAGDAIVIAPESTPPGVIRRVRCEGRTVLWWLLAPSGVLTPSRPDIRVDDLLLAFSAFALPDHKPNLFVDPRPTALIEAAYRLYQPHRLGNRSVVIYTGKGRLRPLPPSLHRFLLTYPIQVITRSFPARKADLIRLLGRARGLVCFDPITNLSLEAANLGVPVYIPDNPYPTSVYRDFFVNLTSHISEDPSLFIERVSAEGPVHKLSPSVLSKQNARAADLLKAVLIDPELKLSVLVDRKLLAHIEGFRRQLIRSRRIQVCYGGAALSSALTPLYVRSLQYSYWQHLVLCNCLSILDNLADLLVKLGLFQLIQLFLSSTIGRVPLRRRRKRRSSSSPSRA